MMARRRPGQTEEGQRGRKRADRQHAQEPVWFRIMASVVARACRIVAQVVARAIQADMAASIVVAAQSQKGQQELADNHGAADHGTDKVNSIHGKPSPWTRKPNAPYKSLFA